MVAPDQAGRIAGNGNQRNQAVHDPAAGRESLAVLFPAGSQILHHSPVAGDEYEGTWLLRDFRHLVFRQWPDQQGRGLGRWWQELGAGGIAVARPEQSVHPISDSMEVG